jgi:hypothetical protein
MALHYNSDSGNRDLPAKAIPLTDQNEVEPPQHVLDYARDVGARLIVRTKYWSPSKPGAWYIKGNRNTDYAQVQLLVEGNLATGRFSRRECWILP